MEGSLSGSWGGQEEKREEGAESLRDTRVEGLKKLLESQTQDPRFTAGECLLQTPRAGGRGFLLREGC